MTHTATRTAELRQMLQDREHELRADLQVRLRDGRAGRSTEGRDDLEHIDTDSLEDIAFSVLQMQAEMAARINEALVRLDGGQYGLCAACGGPILESRLRALPFAVRCLACESGRERATGHAQPMGWRRSGLAVFASPPGA
jgi:DnaK suppressor protein